MKAIKYLFLLCFVSFSLCGSAQTVMGIDIKTTMKKFKPQIVAKGGKLLKSVEGNYEYKVKFAGYPDCTMKVEFNTDNDLIVSVAIFFPHESFDGDKSIYEEMCRQFNEKYGFVDEVDFTQFGRPNKWSNFGKPRKATVFWFWDEKKYVYVYYETGAIRHENKSYSPDI